MIEVERATNSFIFEDYKRNRKTNFCPHSTYKSKLLTLNSGSQSIKFKSWNKGKLVKRDLEDKSNVISSFSERIKRILKEEDQLTLNSTHMGISLFNQENYDLKVDHSEKVSKEIKIKFKSNLIEKATCSEIISTLPYCMFLSIQSYLSLQDLIKSSVVCQAWKSHYETNIASSNSFQTVVTSNYKSVKELSILLNKLKESSHIKILAQLIKKDYGNSIYSFANRSIAVLKINELESENKQSILECFKIKPVKVKSSNFISDASVSEICQSSFNSLKELNLRSCCLVTGSIANSISNCKVLQTLEISDNQ